MAGSYESGEATIAAFHCTVHGAYLSGVREARTVIERR
ncbi:MAG: FAD-dependent oxidoreductase [Phaeodactylibacter sp.]|nr:FAD-dependent oxidoreductase [Phaeodactylibacter sp.]MCB9300113.1 FAD-dependent oxidoreductase [Lewinellaceae bacterium]